MSNFEFLRADFPQVHTEAHRAEQYAGVDARSSCFYARRALELALRWAFEVDETLSRPYRDDLAGMIHEPTLRRLATSDVQAKMEIVRRKGNAAVHDARHPSRKDAETSLEQLFHILYWFARTYAPLTEALRADVRFDVGRLPDPAARAAARARTQAEMERLATQAAQADDALARERERSTTLEAELAELRAQVAAAKLANSAVKDTHDYDEARTRDLFIDLLLREAGWALDGPHDTEYPITGMPNQSGNGRVDYVLWGTDGLPLALVEAKRTQRDTLEGQQQAKLYADALEARFGRRPVIYCTNGHEHWMWDDHPATGYPPRRVAGFRTADELELLVSRRTARRDLTSATIDEHIAGRYYQTQAIRAVGEAFHQENKREALLVMATGTGKTRTVVALVDQLMKAGWVKRVLFLADRVALVNQAVGAFKEHLPSTSPVNLVTDRGAEGRVYVSTYPTMMNLIDQKSGESRTFGPGYFDLVIIDEAHRSVYQKYGVIFDWFDSLLIGLTATPKDEIDRNTYSLFHLENGVPTYAYSLEQAVADEYLVPMRAVSVPLKFQREGIRYADLSDDQKDEWDALEWGEDGAPEGVTADAVNKWLFNADTVDKMLESLMTLGMRVGGGDRIAKTIVFAKNADHANFIAERFNLAYPEIKGEWARVITYRTEYAQSLIDDFSTPGKAPHIAISVDMLDTGIDVPDVANLVFFKIVRSSSKFWQMIGRGTRLRPDLFGPEVDKEEFYVLDFCQNLEFFGENPRGIEGSTQQSVSQQIFTAQTELLAALSASEGPANAGRGVPNGAAVTTLTGLRDHLATDLHAKVVGMTLDNFVVRPARRWVETYGNPASWQSLDAQAARDVVENLAGLPTAVRDDDEAAKRFDLVLLKLQLGVLDPTLATDRLRRQVQQIADGLLDQTAIPAIAEQAELLAELAGDEWWQDVTLPLLELARRRVRALVRLLARTKQPIVYTNFEDTLGEFSIVEMGNPQVGVDPERYKEKVRSYLRAHEDHTALQKLRRGRQLTATDVNELERMLEESGVGSEEDLAAASAAANGLGRFIRSLIGMEKSAVNEAFAEFLAGETHSRDQIDFVRHVVTHLSRNGVMDAEVFYDPPFTDVAPGGPEDVFDDGGDRILTIVRALDETAGVAVAS